MKLRRLKEVCDRLSINKRPSNNVMGGGFRWVQSQIKLDIRG